MNATILMNGLLVIAAIGVMGMSTRADDEAASTQVVTTDIALKESSITMKVGQTHMLTATVSPANATGTTLTWYSDNADVVRVENGVVTAVTPGKAVVTTSAGGVADMCTITVVD